MNCHNSQKYLEDYCDGLLSDAQTSPINAHIKHCPSCTHTINMHHDYLKKLQNCKQMTVSKNSKILDLISVQKPQQLSKISTAMIAASVLFVLAISMQYTPPLLNSHTAYVNTLQTVEVIIHAPNDMDDTALTLALPEGTFLDGFDNHEKITWSVDLKSGNNRLTLPIQIKNSKQRILNIEITMRYKNKTKEFQLGVAESYLNDHTNGAIFFATPLSHGV